MNNFTTWLGENKLVASLAACFLVATGALAWFSYSSWEDYAAAQSDYSSNASKLAALSHRNPFPTETNLTILSEHLKQRQADLLQLEKTLQGYNIPAFGNLDKVKSQDGPQQFQDALRNEVTRIKALAASDGTTLPPGFYLGLEEYENALPQQEEVIPLVKQLTVLSWMAENLVTQKGLILTEFVRNVSSASSKKENAGSMKKTTSPLADATSNPYQSAGAMRISFRCNQGSFREIINAISSSPYFLLIEGLQLQNTSTEPPRRDAVAQSADTTQNGTNAVQRLPIIVGRELLNISMKIRTLEFQTGAQSSIPLPTP
jgi:hypothetical protein